MQLYRNKPNFVIPQLKFTVNTRGLHIISKRKVGISFSCAEPLYSPGCHGDVSQGDPLAYQPGPGDERAANGKGTSRGAGTIQVDS